MKYFLLLFSLVGHGAFAAGDAPDIAAAEAYSRRVDNKLFRAEVKPVWLPDGKSFWYRVKTGPQTREYVLVDATTGSRKAAATLHSLGLAGADEVKATSLKILSGNTKRTGDPLELKFINDLDDPVELFWINSKGERVPQGKLAPGGERAARTYAGHVWRVVRGKETMVSFEAVESMGVLRIDGKSQPVARPAHESSMRAPDSSYARTSPDGRWSAWVEKGRVALKDLKTGGARSSYLKTSMDEKSPFNGTPEWAPDSKSFVVCSVAPVKTRKITIVESAPKDQLQPALIQIDYAKPGDELPQPFPVVFHLTEGGYEWTRIKADLFPNQFNHSPRLRVRWAADSGEFFFDYNQRGHQLYRICAADAKTGAVRVVVEETSKTFIDHNQKTWRQWLDKTGELLWMSERDGWCHLWLYDVNSGRVKNQVTQGAWVVREVLHVDEAAREVWFMAGGIREGEDPYHTHLCRVKFDGTDMIRLTQGDGQHKVQFSPKRDFFVDTWSRADKPPVNELRRSQDGGLVCILEEADARDLYASGWTIPERFIAKGRDGRTDIHGVICKPSKFDPAKQYPVLERVYAGPHSAYAPKEFGTLTNQHSLADLGFIVVQSDGMGTNHRGKAFHEVCWKNLKDAGFPDRIAWIKAAAQSRPWMDLDRVGIYGGSAGGQNAMRALLDHYPFYKVAVADCGCHDNRMDKIWWNEQWMGWPVDEAYERSSNVADAFKLGGRLLLTVGEVDVNVDPASTLQVVAALQKAGKSFEFMPIAGSGHSAGETKFGSRLRMEFLVKNLLFWGNKSL